MKILPSLENVRIAVLGLGYVGLPLAVYLARKFEVVGFDISKRRLEELKAGRDVTGEVSAEEMELAKGLTYSADVEHLKSCNFFIVTVPTPIDAAKRPDLTALERASAVVGSAISKGGIVVFESTVFPGATEDVCVPIIEKASGLKFNEDFFAGYSPERINPGDHSRRLPNIRKITSGSTTAAADLVDKVYASVIEAGTFKASSIRVAEAAKVIENVQRDLNIALVNELAQLFKKLGIETREVLEAAGTKWNFHGYRPGLVGGHCIGVDPYYLTHKAQSVGFHPEIVLAGRRINDGMPAFVASDIVKAMVGRDIDIRAARLLVMGFTFKENTKVADLVQELSQFVREVRVFDPLADIGDAKHEYGIDVENEPPKGPFDGIVLCVKHDQIRDLGASWMRARLKPSRGFIFDLKEVLPIHESDVRL